MLESISTQVLLTAGSLETGGFVSSIALLVGVVVPLIVSGLAYVKAKSQEPIIREAVDTATYVGQLATLTANKALENKQNLKALLDFTITMLPDEAKKTLAERVALIELLNKEIQATEAQIRRIVPMIPGRANADTIGDLPREGDF